MNTGYMSCMILEQLMEIMMLKYDWLSPVSWEIEGYKTVYVDDMFFDDSYMIHLALDSITLEPISGDDMETELEPVFWLSSKDMDVTMELTESELIPYLGG